MSTRIILGETEDAAWAKAAQVLRDVQRSMADLAGKGELPGVLGKNAVAEARAREGDVLDERLWVGIARATNFQKAASTIVGTPDSVAAALRKYHELGVTRFLISGFDPLEDIAELGRDLIPRIRAFE